MTVSCDATICLEHFFYLQKEKQTHLWDRDCTHNQLSQHTAPYLLSASACSIFYPPNIHRHCFCLLANKKIMWVGGNLNWTIAKCKHVSVVTHVQPNKGALSVQVWNLTLLPTSDSPLSITLNLLQPLCLLNL